MAVAQSGQIDRRGGTEIGQLGAMGAQQKDCFADVALRLFTA